MKLSQVTSIVISIFFIVSCSTPTTKMNEGETFHPYADRIYQENIDRHPEWQTYQGIKKDYDKLEDMSEASDLEEHARTIALEKYISTIESKSVNTDERLSLSLFKKSLKQRIEGHKWRNHHYPVNQMFGRHSSLPAFMINMHRIDNASDARAYISRIKAMLVNFDQLQEHIDQQASKGIIPPRFVFPKVAGNIEELLKGKPLSDAKKDHILLGDFKKKLTKLKITQDLKEELTSELEEALEDSFKPAYKNFLTFWRELEKRADDKAGAWKLPGGPEFYIHRLKDYTTTDMTPQQIHDVGLSNVKRIHRQMEVIKKKVGYKKDLKSFFDYVRVNPKLYYSNNESGRLKYLADTKKTIGNMKKRLPKFFGKLPKADLIVKRVEAFREKTSGSAFYNRPAPDGSRPGIYYVSLYNMMEQPIYQLEALAFHEALPGHHMQLSIAMEQTNLPKFRRFGGYTAYTEGWGLYAERLAKDMGFYKNLYSDFGRLSMELRRACRLVVDTGIHYKKWTRQQAIDYLMISTPDALEDHIRAVERYIINPGQATAYMIGMLKILELRSLSKKAFGSKFDIRKFHDLVLGSGALPLDMLERKIELWIAKEAKVKKGKKVITI